MFHHVDIKKQKKPAQTMTLKHHAVFKIFTFFPTILREAPRKSNSENQFLKDEQRLSLMTDVCWEFSSTFEL